MVYAKIFLRTYRRGRRSNNDIVPPHIRPLRGHLLPGEGTFSPSPGRGWHGEAVTGVGRYTVRIWLSGNPTLPRPTSALRAPSPRRRHVLALSWERVARRSRDGCGAVHGANLAVRESYPSPPHIRPSGTFSQEKARSCPLLGEGGTAEP